MNWYVDVLKKYTVFTGRASREEYWMFTLINFVVSLFVGVIAKAIGVDALDSLYLIAVIIPSVAVGIRRLHDTNRSGWFMFLSFIPIVGWIVLIIFFIQDSDVDTNQYGPNPKNGDVSSTPSSTVPSQESKLSQEPTPNSAIVEAPEILVETNEQKTS